MSGMINKLKLHRTHCEEKIVSQFIGKCLRIVLFFVIMTLPYFSCSSLPGKSESEPVTEKYKSAQQTYSLGETQLRQGLYKGAMDNFEAALYQFAALDERTGVIRALLAMGQCAAALENYDKARACFDWALPLAEDTEDPRLIRDVSNHYGNYYLGKDELDEAETWLVYGPAYEEPTAELAEFYRLSGTIEKRKGNYEEALSFYGKALDVDSHIPDSLQTGTDHYLSGSAYSLTGNYEKAEASLREALVLDRNFELLPGIASDLSALARVLEKAGRSSEALLYYRRAYLAWEGLDNTARVGELKTKLENIGGNTSDYP